MTMRFPSSVFPLQEGTGAWPLRWSRSPEVRVDILNLFLSRSSYWMPCTLRGAIYSSIWEAYKSLDGNGLLALGSGVINCINVGATVGGARRRITDHAFLTAFFSCSGASARSFSLPHSRYRA